MAWILPRGLITIVLALQVLEGVTTGLAFLSGLAFVAILFTNLLVICGGIRMRKIGDSSMEAGVIPDATTDAAPLS
jgi:hypothetical protein